MSEMLRHYQGQRIKASQQRVRLTELASEYRETMDVDILRSWAADVVAAINAADLP
jgi:hypothetical protein